MKKMITFGLTFAVIVGLTLSPIVQYQANAAMEDKMMEKLLYMDGALTAPTDGKPFGGVDVGSYKVRVKDSNKVTIIAKVTITMMEDKMMKDTMMETQVLEGWLVDMQSGYKLSTGQLSERNTLVFTQRIVNPWIYDLFVITVEPFQDTDPNPNTPVAGVQLGKPFGQ